MGTRIAWWLNLDAGLELERGARYVRSASMEQRMRAMAPRLDLLLAPGDVVLDGSMRAEALTDCVPLAFCLTPSARAALRASGFAALDTPALELLQRVSRRSFAAALGQSLPSATYVESLDALRAWVERERSFTGEWLLKRDYSFAARERRRIRGSALDLSTLGFAKRSFERGEGLQLEPYVERMGDFARHGYVLESGAVLVGPHVRQVCDARGAWLLSQLGAEGELSAVEDAALERSVREAGCALHQAGYAGPYGVDAFRYRGPDAQIAFQPRSEINVRFSMGYPRVLLERALDAKRQSGGECDLLESAHALEPPAPQL